ncbi:S66 peptidase family protein [Owenweeksia hongkongensis]|uniref:S66 peptidase family protein n=1 Tax=Owenweeksia hongkongensis TaxID=253245 RepID=UPI003A921E59
MITPPALKSGDTIAIISTARKISREELEPAVAEITKRGFKVLFGKNLFEEENQFSGSDTHRTVDMQACMDNPEVKAILCARGGYGTVRIIDKVDFSRFANSPKWICGYSDVTVLHNKLCNLGVESLHSTMPVNFTTNTPEALDSLFDALMGKSPEYHFESHPYNRKGVAEGKLIGGNLSMLYSQTGSNTALQTEGAILFIEDLDEYLYHIDRMMYNLKRNGYFENLAGVIVGGMSDMNDNTIPFGKTAEEIIRDHFAEYDFPICFGFPAGHVADNRSLIMGREVKLNVSENSSLYF